MPAARIDVRTLLAANNVVLGPMAGITEAPFRGICKRMGAGLTYTEMISTTALHHNPDSAISKALLTFSAEETPCAVQLFGSDPRVMVAQATRVLERHCEDVALIDVNMGCPVSKVVARNEGSALMRTPQLAAEIVQRLVSACDVPVTVKMRSGWDGASVNAVEFARAMEAAGASALAVHGRTRSQFYTGKADWDVIAAVKAAVAVPVMGSGDVLSARAAADMLERTDVDGVIVARGARGNPWIFREARSLIDTGVECPPPTPCERVDMAREHLAALVEFAGARAYVRMRKHVVWYAAGVPGATYLRERANAAASNEELDDLLLEYRTFLEDRSRPCRLADSCSRFARAARRLVPPDGRVTAPFGETNTPLGKSPRKALALCPKSGRIRIARSSRTRMGRTARGCSFGGRVASRFCVRSSIRRTIARGRRPLRCHSALTSFGYTGLSTRGVLPGRHGLQAGRRSTSCVPLRSG